jgi:hypothetical protein
MMAACQRDASLLQLYRVFPGVAVERLGMQQDCDVLENSSITGAMTEEHCLSIALRILDTLASIPQSSGTQPFQAILLLSTSSELKFSTVTDITVPLGQVELEASSVMDSSVANARDFVVNRLTTSQGLIPGGRLVKLLGTIQEIWCLLDKDHGDKNVYWFDVVMQ